MLIRRPGDAVLVTDSVLPGSADSAPPAPPRPAATGSGWLYLVVGSLALAIVLTETVVPHSIAYDPWSWLIWGREIAHFHLDTRLSATSVKPLAIFLDVGLMVAGSHAPLLWLIIARAATLLALALAFRIGWRFGGVLAGFGAFASLIVCHQLLSYLFLYGMSEPMAAAAMLAAAECELTGRRRWTLVCLVAAGLLRAEAWPFVLLYCFWLGRSSTSTWRRLGLAVLGVGTVVVWFLIDKIGANQFSRSADAATHATLPGPLMTKHPGLATIRETWPLMSPPVVVLFLLGTAIAIERWRRSGRIGPPVWFAAAAVAWLVVDALLAQGKFATGAPRYLDPGVALASVVAGYAVAEVVGAIRRLASPSRAAAITAVGLAATAGLFTNVGITTIHSIRGGYHNSRLTVSQTKTFRELVRNAGGSAAVLRCGPIKTSPFQLPYVAWKLHLHLEQVDISPGPTGTVLQLVGRPAIPPEYASNYHQVATGGSGPSSWVMYSSC